MRVLPFFAFTALDGRETWVCGHVMVLENGSIETGIRAYMTRGVTD